MNAGVILVGLGIGAAWLWMRQGAQPGIDNTILDARDAWAADDQLFPVDQTILDPRDWLAQNTVPYIDLGPYDEYTDAGYEGAPYLDLTGGTQYDPMGNVINVRYWGDTMRWNESMIPAQFLQPIRNAESRNRLPHNLLARQLWQESRYNPSAVNQWSGAQGIAQFMPATAASFGIDPFNPQQAIDAAGRYMQELYGKTGSWLLALAAYNWGIGNLTRKGIQAAPNETKNYYTQILADIGMSAVTA